MSEEKNTGEDAKAKMLAALAKKQKCLPPLLKNKRVQPQAKVQDLLQDLRLALGKLVALPQRCIDANLVQLNKHYLAKWELQIQSTSYCL